MKRATIAELRNTLSRHLESVTLDGRQAVTAQREGFRVPSAG